MSSQESEALQEVPANRICVARQPILDDRQELFAYELLFRDGVGTLTKDIQPDFATRSLLLSSYVDIGIDRVAGTHPAFVNFTAETIVAGTPRLFQPDRLVIEVLETVDPTPEVLRELEALRSDGYTIALDDYDNDARLDPFIPLANIVKIDFMAMTRPEIERLVEQLRSADKTLLAEKVETAEEFEWGQSVGFDFYQGFYFAKPELVKSGKLSASRVNLLRVMAEVSREDYDPRELELLITRDVSLTYKLLRYINSVAFRTVDKVSTIKHAIVMLGGTEFRKFMALLVAAEVARDKPLELTRAALLRGRLCEELAWSPDSGADRSGYFLLGIFSLLDAMLDMPMSSVLEQLPLPEEVKLALANREGLMAGYLDLAEAFENADWPAVTKCCEAISLDESFAVDCYAQAMLWADDVMAVASE